MYESTPEKEARNNKEAIKAIADTVIFLGREGLPFRGHEDDTKHHAEVEEQSINSVGLFINLLNFQVSPGDNVLKKHLSTAAKKCKIHISSNTKSVNRMCWESHI